ncbi:FkbM family methyltransferase [Amorphus coralli]|uniref:FkbM family methyltransferase n=1 Tax=Amorphus coralli TaxID=340680 RepID=UPI00037E8D3E|nr:FkbM family methyltransferase [Amorphus coralli]
MMMEMAATPTEPFGSLRPGASTRAMLALARGRRFAPGVRGWVRRHVRPLIPDAEIDIDVEGFAFRVSPRDNKDGFDLAAKHRLPEAEERAFVLAQLRPGDLFVDIGGNLGVYTIPTAARAPEGVRVVTFEPHPVSRGRLAYNIAANGVADRVSVEPVAVGPEPSTATLWANASGNQGRASLHAFAGDRSKGYEVEVAPLAERLARYDAPVGVLKIDIEGFEDQALVPYFASVPAERWPRAIVVETTHAALWREDLLQALAARGYVTVARNAENAMLIMTGADAAPSAEPR